MVVAEALGHGVPVVVSRGTPWQRVEREGCGLWVGNRPEELAAAGVPHFCVTEPGASGLAAWVTGLANG